MRFEVLAVCLLENVGAGGFRFIQRLKSSQGGQLEPDIITLAVLKEWCIKESDTCTYDRLHFVLNRAFPLAAVALEEYEESGENATRRII